MSTTKNEFSKNGSYSTRRYNASLKPLDALYGPWDSVDEFVHTVAEDDEAIIDDLSEVLETGLTIGIIEDGKVVEYWNPKNNIEFVKKAVGGSTGGSTVSVTPSLTEGTEVAKITVDGTEAILYAPTPTEGGGTSVTIADNLDTDDSTQALSAKQGKKLNEAKQDKLVDGSVTSNLIATSAVTTDKLADESVTSGKLSADVKAMMSGADPEVIKEAVNTYLAENPLGSAESIAYGEDSNVGAELDKIDDAIGFPKAKEPEDITLDVNWASGKYYINSSGKVVTTGSSGSYSAYTEADGKLQGIDISQYVGGTLRLERNTAASSSRSCLVTTEDNTVIKYWTTFQDEGDNIYAVEYVIPSTAKYLFLSTSSSSLITAKITMPAMGEEETGILKDIKNLKNEPKSVNLLVIGNSYARNSFSYVPFILDSIAPNVYYRIGIAFTGSCSLQQHLANISNEDVSWNGETYNPANYLKFYYIEKKFGKWTESSSYPASDMLSKAKWDIISIQQESNTAYLDYDTNYGSLPNDIYTILASKVGNFRPAFNLIHSSTKGHVQTGPSNIERWEGMRDNAKNIVKKCPVDIIFPYGTAIQNLRTTPLAEIGDGSEKELTVDNSHLQNGLPMMCAAYASAYKLLNTIGVKTSVFGDSTEIDDSFIGTNVAPAGSFGPVIGITPDNLIIAQAAAIAAVRNPFEITDLTGKAEDGTSGSIGDGSYDQNIKELVNTVNGYTAIIKPELVYHTGYKYDTKFPTLEEQSSSQYADDIDISDFVGCKMDIIASTFFVNRSLGIVDDNNLTLIKYRGMGGSTGNGATSEDNKVTLSFIIPERSKFLKLSCATNVSFSVEITKIEKSLVEKVYEYTNNSLAEKINRNFVTGKNLIDPDKLEDGAVSSQGSVTASQGYSTTDFIKVTKNVPITCYSKLRYYYTCDNDFSNGTRVDCSGQTIKTVIPPRDGFIRFTFNSEYLKSAEYTNNVDIDEEGNASTTREIDLVYHPYYVESKIEEDIKPSKTIKENVGNILYGKKWAVLGDSFTAGGGGLDTITEPGPYIGELQCYPYLIGNRNDMDIVRLFEAGKTLAYPSDGSFINSATCPTSAMYYQNIPEDADYITIMLGINDAGHSGSGVTEDGEDATGVLSLGEIGDTDTSTYYGAWNTVMMWIKENRPFAHVGIIVTNGLQSHEDYVEAQIAIAKKYGVPYLNLNGDERTPAMIRCYNPDIPQSVKNIINETQGVNFSGNGEGAINKHPNTKAHNYESHFIETWLRGI